MSKIGLYYFHWVFSCFTILVHRAGLKPIGLIAPNWAPRPILQTLVQVDWEPGSTEIVPKWAPHLLRPALLVHHIHTYIHTCTRTYVCKSIHTHLHTLNKLRQNIIRSSIGVLQGFLLGVYFFLIFNWCSI